jgi:hypothetical protein
MLERRLTMTPKLGPHTRVQVSSSTYARPFGEELVLLEFGRGEYFALDEIGARVWKRLESGIALGAIAAEIATAYDVSEEKALDDIVALITDMHMRALVEPIVA